MKYLLSLSLCLFFVGSVIAQSACSLTVTKSGNFTNRTYTCSSNAISPAYSITVYNNNPPNTISTSSTATITVNSNYGTYYYVTAYVTGANGCTDSVRFNDTVAGPMMCPTTINLFPYDSISKNAYSFGLDYMYSGYAPGYISNISFDYGDGTSGSAWGHTYASTPSNTQVIATVSYTHPTQPTCTLKDTTYLNPSNCMGLAHAISYVTPSNATYQFVNTVSTVPGAPVVPSTRWFLKSPSGISYNIFGIGNTLNRTFTNNGVHSLIAITTWRDSASNSICTARDTASVNVTTVTNNLSVQVLLDSIASFAQFVSPQVRTWLIKKDNSAGTLTAVDSVTSSVVTNGYPYYANAYFSNIPSGTYLVKSHLINQPAGLTGGFLPTYIYKQAYWANADSFVFTGVTSLSKTNRLLTGIPGSGPGFVGGLISAGANRGTAVGDPVEGTTVLLRNAAGIVVRAATTSSNGRYSFPDLPAGGYSVYPEEAGFTTTPSDVLNVATSTQQTVVIDFRRNASAKEYVPGNVLGVGAISETAFLVAPNPATAKLHLTLGQSADKVTATLSNIAGQVVLQETLTGNNAEMNISQLPAGTYLLQLQSGAEVHTEKVQVQH